jgi:hypothetical protein
MNDGRNLMYSDTPAERAGTTVSATAGVAFGIGTVLLALFPFAIPFLVLTAVAVAPLALLGLVPMFVVALGVGLWLGARAIFNGIRNRPRRERLVVAGSEGR